MAHYVNSSWSQFHKMTALEFMKENCNAHEMMQAIDCVVGQILARYDYSGYPLVKLLLASVDRLKRQLLDSSMPKEVRYLKSVELFKKTSDFLARNEDPNELLDFINRAMPVIRIRMLTYYNISEDLRFRILQDHHRSEGTDMRDLAAILEDGISLV